MIDITDLQAIVIPFIVTLCFFYVEAIIHYNMGKYDKIGFKMPSLHENFKIIAIISVFSLMSSGVTYLLEMYFSK
tara:strand:- start:106 stop:330 length:225 start_codon:yes stop_codon:yes gene_type:complete